MLLDLNTWSLVHLKEKLVYCRKGYLLVHGTLLVQLQEKKQHTWVSHTSRPISHTLGRSHTIFFKCVFFFDLHTLYLLILMRALRNYWEQRETRAPRGMLVKAMTAIVWAAWTTTQNLPERRYSIYILSLEHCHSEVWLTYILIRASEKASKSLHCTI